MIVSNYLLNLFLNINLSRKSFKAHATAAVWVVEGEGRDGEPGYLVGMHYANVFNLNRL